MGIINGVSQSLFWAFCASLSNIIGGKIPSNAQAIIHSKFRNDRFGFSATKVKSFRSTLCKVCHSVTTLTKLHTEILYVRWHRSLLLTSELVLSVYRFYTLL